MIVFRVSYIGIKPQKGSEALSLQSVEIKIGHGICGDLSANVSERQVSIIIKHSERVTVKNSDGGFCKVRFKPNLVLEAITPLDISIKDRLMIGSCELEITVAGKKCHADCPLFDNVQTCDFNKDVFFAKVLKDGVINLNDEASIRRDLGI